MNNLYDRLKLAVKEPKNSFMLTPEEVEEILDLKEENERYKKIFQGKERFSKLMPEDMDFIILSKADYDRQQEDIELIAIEQKQRIDKAIYLIKDAGCYDEEMKQFCDDIWDELPDLLEILQGSDE